MMAVRPEGLLPSAQIRQEMHAAEEQPIDAGTGSKSGATRKEASA
jgi:hypothetical protein